MSRSRRYLKARGPVRTVTAPPAVPASPAVELADSRAHFDEIGRTGTVYFSGILSDDEYNSDLVGEKAIKVYDQMWRSDAKVAAAVKVCMLPLLQAEWSVKAASEDAVDVEAAQFVQDNLFGGMAVTWYRFLEHSLSMLRYGFSIAEKVWSRGDDGKVRLAKIAPRLAKTAYRWYPGPDDELAYLQQRVWVQSKDGKTGTYEFRDIPREKLVLFTINREGNNYQGVSILRQAYKHWFYKDTLYRIDAIAAERNGMGVPVAIEPEGAVRDVDRAATANALSSFHAHQKGYLIFPHGYDFRLLGVDGNIKDLVPSIEHHDLMIAVSVLAQFLNLNKGGSYALSKDISGFFLDALHAIAQLIRDEVNDSVIRPLVDFNFAVERYPTLEVAELDTRDVDEWMKAIAPLFRVGALTANPETENAIRKLLHLPDLPPEATAAGGGAETVDTDSQGDAAGGEDEAADEGAEDADTKPVAGKGPKAEPEGKPPEAESAAAAKPKDEERKLTLEEDAERQRAEIEALITSLTGDIVRDAERLADETDAYSQDDFERDLMLLILLSLLSSYSTGAGVDVVAVRNTFTANAWGWAATRSQAQMVYVRGFANDIATAVSGRGGNLAISLRVGEPSVTGPGALDRGKVEDRAKLYGGVIWSGLQRGIVDGGKDRAPADTEGRITWTTSGDEGVCTKCGPRDGQVYTAATLPGFPGDGSFGELCDGGPMCRCFLTYSPGVADAEAP